MSARLCHGNYATPRFWHHRLGFRCFSQWFTHVRLLVTHLTRSRRAFSATLTTPALNRRSLRWFGLPTCIGEPGGPTSITGTARFVLATFYITITLLSGHTADRRFWRTEGRQGDGSRLNLDPPMNSR